MVSRLLTVYRALKTSTITRAFHHLMRFEMNKLKSLPTACRMSSKKQESQETLNKETLKKNLIWYWKLMISFWTGR